jgi:hypothetical protein
MLKISNWVSDTFFSVSQKVYDTAGITYLFEAYIKLDASANDVTGCYALLDAAGGAFYGFLWDFVRES